MTYIQVDVATVIQAVQPDVVILELCKYRTDVLHFDEETAVEEMQNLPKKIIKNLTVDKMMTIDDGKMIDIKQNWTVEVIFHSTVDMGV